MPLESGGVNCVPIPAQSPNCNPHAEPFVRTARTECLDHSSSSARVICATFSRSLSRTTTPSATTRASVAGSSGRARRRATTPRCSDRSSATRVSVDSSDSTIGRPPDVPRRLFRILLRRRTLTRLDHGLAQRRTQSRTLARALEAAAAAGRFEAVAPLARELEVRRLARERSRRRASLHRLPS
jgi:hypothetical protein